MENPRRLTLAATTTTEKPHVAVCPSAGMGHLAPFLRLAAALSSKPYNCKVTLVVIVPTITAAESDHITSFFSAHPDIHRLDFPVDSSPVASGDPFFIRYDTICRCAHLLTTHLSSVSPPLSAVFSDLLLTKGLNTTLPDVIQNYTVITTSARFLCFMAYLPQFLKSSPLPGNPAEIPGFAPVPSENIPPPFFDPDHIFTKMLVSNAQFLNFSKGILLNTFDSFEPETLSSLSTQLPPVFAVGPHRSLVSSSIHKDDVTSWLDKQPVKSVMYVSFGNRTVLSKEQIRELGLGLEKSGCRFLWVVKSSMVDKEENEGLESLLGKELCVKLGGRGKVVKRWVRQEEILGHQAVGGFLSHCGWNSVVEAAVEGVPVVCWPQHGDQRENAGVVEKAGLGEWERGWGSGVGVGGGKVVGAAEIAVKVRDVMGKEALRRSAWEVGVEAKKAREDGGTSAANLMGIVGSLKQRNKSEEL